MKFSINSTSHRLVAVAGLVASIGNAAAAPQGCITAAQLPIKGPFYLSAIPANGSSPIPAGVETVSRSVQILASEKEYSQQFIYLEKTHQICKASDPTFCTTDLTPGLNPIFDVQTFDSKFFQLVKDCKVYLVKDGDQNVTTDVWSAIPNTGNTPGITYEGQSGGDEKPNSALRIDVQKPTLAK